MSDQIVLMIFPLPGRGTATFRDTVIVLLALVVIQAQAQTTWNAAADFTIAPASPTNINGVWTYGYANGGGAAAGLMNVKTASYNGIANFPAWSYSGSANAGLPVVFKNLTDVTRYGVPSGELAIHPDVPGGVAEHPIIWFTPPQAGNYQVRVAYNYVGGGDGVVASVSKNLFLGGGAPAFSVWSQLANNAAPVAGYTNNLLYLSTGDNLAFAVNANGGFGADSTVVDLQVSGPLPTPFPGQTVPMDLAAPLALSWVQNLSAVGYDVYLGTVSNGVFTATTNTSGVFQGRTGSVSLSVNGLLPETTYYWRVDAVGAGGALTKGPVNSFTTGQTQVDVMADTWVATDGLSRSLPGLAECGSPRTNRPVGMFYFLWHNSVPGYGSGTNWDVSKWIAGHPFTNPNNPWADNPIFQTAKATYWWGEPELGYYRADDPWVLRRQIALLTHAGVDVLIFDYSNAVTYDSELDALCEMIRRMRCEGFKTNLKIAFLTHSHSAWTATYLYNTLYRANKYSDLWFYWQGKPLMLGYPDGLDANDTPASPEVKAFFTWRTSWANVTQLQNEWQWIDLTPQHWGWDTRYDLPEELSVTCGGWADANIGRSYVNRTQPALDNYHLPPARTQDKGLLFREQMSYALKYDPQFLYVVSWNEWIAGSFGATTPDKYMLGNLCPLDGYYFVDEYNQEYSRDLEPMKGGHTDNYYFQMAGQNRRRKGVRPVPPASAPQTINISGDFAQWANVSPAYYDAANDTAWRNFASSVGQVGNYTNNTGRNDFTLLKVARDANNLYFLAQCNSNLTSYAGSNWMVLFIDADQNHSTGWEGYDYAVNLGARTGSTTTLSRSPTTNWNWTAVLNGIAYAVSGNQLMLAIPRASLGLANDPVSFDFHWADNFQVVGDINDWGVNGDSAPDRRFNYRYQAATNVETVLLSDDFESGKLSGWGAAWSAGSRWDLTGSTSYSSNHCAQYNVSQGGVAGALATTLNTSGCSSFRVTFRYKLHGLASPITVNVGYWGSQSWVTITNLCRDQYYPAGQAWGYDERQDVWLYYTDVRHNAGADAQFFANGFAMRIDPSGLTSASQTLWIDDVQIVGLASTNQATAATWNVAADFSLTANPSGAWKYQWANANKKSMGLMNASTANYAGNAGLQAWYSSASPSIPIVCQNNNTTNTYYGWAPGILGLHPNQGSYTHAIATWTAPFNGVYRFVSAFRFVGEPLSDGVNASVLRNLTPTGSTLFATALITPGSPTLTWNSSLSLSAGDTISWAVNPNANPGGDSTALSAVVTAISPGPPPKLTNAIVVGGTAFQFIIPGSGSGTYVVQATTSLAAGSAGWQSIQTNITLPATIADTNALSLYPQRFYRVLMQ